jgi:DNA-directed RNA polymerase subunit RPC12/RpoP
MSWFLNYYECARCREPWSDEWSATCDDDCPHCGARHMSPYKSDDLTEIIEMRANKFVVLRSAKTAEHFPKYRKVAQFDSREQAEAFISAR